MANGTFRPGDRLASYTVANGNNTDHIQKVALVEADGDSIPAASEYETVAASQTAQVLGATGATGDYLSHVIFQPTTTGAGTCTILDNATVIYTFTTGTLGDLRPVVIPIGAKSVSGAWKITTGANVTATAFGDFT